MPITRGMILAAGLGTRLLPVSKTIPKPIVPVLNVPNVVHTIALLKRAGVHEIILNLHYLPDPIKQFLGTGEKWGVRLEYSMEPQILGTGGGVKKAERFFREEPFLLANCDFVTDIDLAPFIEAHTKRQAFATMVLIEDPARQALYSPVAASASGTLCSLRGKQNAPVVRTGIFTGLHVLSPEIFGFLRPTPCGINDLLYPALMESHPDRALALFAGPHNFWLDTGEFSTLFESTQFLLSRLESSKALRDLLAAAGHKETRPGIWVGEGTQIPRNTELVAPLVIGHHAQLGGNMVLGPHAVIGNGVVLGDKARVSQALLLDGAKPAQGAHREIVFENTSVWKK